MASLQNVSRREFLGILGLSGGGLVLAAPPARAWSPSAVAATTNALAPNVFLSIDSAGLVTIVCHRSEMGQGVRTALPMIVADELEADWKQVKVVQAEGDKKYGEQATDGSRSGRGDWLKLRQAGAAARTMLEQAAADRWGVPVTEVQARMHAVVHTASNRALGFGELAVAAGALKVPDAASLRLKPRSAFRFIGKDVPMLDGPDLVTGRGIFGIDVVRPGMKHAVIARPPVYGGRVTAVDDAAATKVRGVERILRLDGAPPPSGFQPLGGVAVIARNTWAALQGREVLKITWDDGPHGAYDSAEYEKALVESARKSGTVARNEGDVDAGLRSATRVFKADYYAPHLAHAPMEPPAAVAEVTADGCQVWASTQDPQSARSEVAKALGIGEERVTVNVTLLGGAFGRKSKPDYCVEAALLSKQVGAPVKVTWSREDEIRHGYYHTVTAQHLEASLDSGNRVTAWLHRTAFPPIPSTFEPNQTRGSAGELGLGAVDVPFAIPNIRCEACEAPAHVRIGWFRSVNNIPHAFAVCSFVDELAAAARRDPKEFLLDLLGPPRHVVPATTEKYENYGESMETHPIDTARFRAVVQAAASKIGWGRTVPKGHGLGIAVHRSFATYVCTALEVSIGTDRSIAIPKVVTAVDCGIAIHPDRVRSQIEGAAIMGISVAIHGQVTFKQGRAEQSNFDTYEVARMPEAPGAIEVVIIDSDAPPGGVGEPGLPPFAPALCNAIFAATGTRIRRLPIGTKVKV
jgi:isoquinoline 1-oxidoreductase subunit beta